MVLVVIFTGWYILYVYKYITYYNVNIRTRFTIYPVRSLQCCN